MNPFALGQTPIVRLDSGFGKQCCRNAGAFVHRHKGWERSPEID